MDLVDKRKRVQLRSWFDRQIGFVDQTTVGSLYRLGFMDGLRKGLGSFTPISSESIEQLSGKEEPIGLLQEADVLLKAIAQQRRKVM